MITLDEITKLIKKKRYSLKKSLKEVSKEIAMDKYKYYRIENGMQMPNFYDIQKILNYYHIDLKIIIHK